MISVTRKYTDSRNRNQVWTTTALCGNCPFFAACSANSCISEKRPSCYEGNIAMGKINRLRKEYKNLATLTIKAGMDKAAFASAVDIELTTEEANNPLEKAAQYCIAARRVALLNGVSKTSVVNARPEIGTY